MGTPNVETRKPDRILFSIKDVCTATGLCYRSIHRAVREGKIQSVRCGGAVKIPAAELKRVCERGF